MILKSGIISNEADQTFRNSAGDILGRVTVLRQDTDKEQISIYCRLHQCSHIVRSGSRTVSVNNSKLKQWFAQGLALGRGKPQQGSHKAQFTRLMRAD